MRHLRNPKTVLEALQKHSTEKGYKFERLYRNLYNPEFYLLAYQNIYANKGSLTKGVDGMTMSGMNMKRINHIIDALKDRSYQPKPARRTYIPKKSGNGLRPLGIPSTEDKLVQEVVRIMLETIYEPTFQNTSHGFRPNRSCHTALTLIQNQFTAVKWFIEGDIKGCFDNIDHHTLVAILRKRIKDEAFIELIWKLLKAGYMEEWCLNQTYSGTPQGSGVSPILANIYMNELDIFIESLKQEFNKGEKRAYNKDYAVTNKELEKHRRYMRNNWEGWTEAERKEAKRKEQQLGEKLRSKPSQNLMDENYKRLVYVRYADDFLIGIIGSRKDAEGVKEKVREFLNDKLKLTLSVEKTFITHGQDKARFLGYDVTINSSTATKKTAKGVKRIYYGRVVLLLPKDKWVGKLKEYDVLEITKDKDGKEVWKPKARNMLMKKEPIEILSLYNAEIRGIYNYYKLARNVSVLNKFRYVMEYSMYKTLAGKYRTKISKIKKRFMVDGVFGIEYETKKGKKRAEFIEASFHHNKKPLFEKVDDLPEYKVDIRPKEVIARFATGKCELCHAGDEPVSICQVKALKDLHGKTDAERYMMRKRRKTIILCDKCREENNL